MFLRVVVDSPGFNHNIKRSKEPGVVTGIMVGRASHDANKLAAGSRVAVSGKAYSTMNRAGEPIYDEDVDEFPVDVDVYALRPLGEQ